MANNIIVVATVVIAVSAIVNTVLVFCIKSSDSKFQETIKKLFRGIVVSNLIDPKASVLSQEGERAIKTFNDLYGKGESEGISLQF